MSEGDISNLVGRMFEYPKGRHLGDSEELNLSKFLHSYLDMRDDLALKRLRGESLTAYEAVFLAVLNRALERMLPPPPPLPQDVLEAVKEVQRLSALRRQTCNDADSRT
jgi:hypothetical protein